MSNPVPHTIPLTSDDLVHMTREGWVVQNTPLAIRGGTLMILTRQSTTVKVDGSTVADFRTIVGFVDEERQPSFDDSRTSFHAGLAVKLGLSMVQAFSRWQAWCGACDTPLVTRRAMEATGFLGGLAAGGTIRQAS